MSYRSVFYLVLALSLACLARAADENSVQKAAKQPEGLSKSVAAAVQAEGVAVQVAGAPACELWWAKEVPLKKGFKPNLLVNYPFLPGHLVGVIRVDAKASFADFRGQPVMPGLYTLRYGQQPQDGNHIGTSETSDFLLAIPAAADADAKPLGSPDPLMKSSAKAAGTNHPAIFSLLPSEDSEPPKTASVAKDADKNLVVLTAAIPGNDAGKKVAVPLRLVLVGKSEG